MDRISSYSIQLQNLAVLYLPRRLMALVALVVGWWIIGRVSRLIGTATTRLFPQLVFAQSGQHRTHGPVPHTYVHNVPA